MATFYLKIVILYLTELHDSYKVTIVCYKVQNCMI